MKKIFFIFFLLSFLLGFIFLYFEGSKLSYLSVFFPHTRKAQLINKAVNQGKNESQIFYGVNVDMNQLVPTSQGYVRNSKGEDLIDVAKKLGINLFRITNASGVTAAGKEKIYTKKQWDLILNKMAENGIKALIVIESDSKNPDMYSKEIKPIYLTLVDNYVIKSGLLENTNVYGIDLKNEPIISENNLSFIKKARDMIRTYNPDIKLTVGWWAVDSNKKDANGNQIYIYDDYNAGQVFNDIVDFYSIHTYGFDRKFLEVYPDPYSLTLYALNKAIPAFGGKPILIEEFGAGNGDAVTDQGTLGSPELQANAYDGLYQAILDLKDENVIGSVAYQLIKRTSKVDGFTIIKDNKNSFYPAAYVLQKYATGKSDVKLNLPLKLISDDYIVENKDNGKTINVKVNDIVGLHLRLNTDFINSLSVSNPSMLLRSEPLSRDNSGQIVDAVYHVTKKGVTIIKVIGKGSGNTVTRFTVTIVAD